jgi:hypothetical protein
MANKLVSDPEKADRVIKRDDNNPPTLLALLIDQIESTWSDEFAKVAPIRAKANALEQKIESDEDLAKWVVVRNEAHELWKDLDAGRKAEKRPFENTVNETFESRTRPLELITEFVKDRADKFNRAKLAKQRAAEAAERERLAEVERKAREDARIAAEFDATDEVVEFVKRYIETQRAVDEVVSTKAAEVTRVVGESGGQSSAQAVWKFRVEDYALIDLNALRGMIAPAEIDKAIARVVKIQKGATKIEGVTVYEDVGTSFRR